MGGIHAGALCLVLFGVVVAILSRRRVVLMKGMDFSQLASLYLYINLVYPFEIERGLYTLRYINIEPLFAHIYQPITKNYTAAELNSMGYSPLMVRNGQMPEGINNTIYALVLITSAWAFVGLFSFILSKLRYHSRTRSIILNMIKATKYSLPNGLLNISIITLTFSAVNTFKHVDLSTKDGVVSLVTSAGSIVFMIGIIAFYLKSLLTKSKTFEDLTSEQEKDKSALSRIYEVVAMIRKFIVAALIAGLFESPAIQLGSVIGVNSLFAIYAVIFNPYGPFYRVFDLISELGNITLSTLIFFFQREPSLTLGSYISLTIFVMSIWYTLVSIV